MNLLRLSFLFLPFLLVSCSGNGDGPLTSQPVEQRKIAVEALRVSKGIFTEYIEASGTLSGKNEAYVVSETQGIIKDLRFDLGDRVEKGQVLLKVDDKIQGINLEQAKIEYDNAKLSYETTKKLYDSGSASQTELNRAESALSGAKAGYESALKAYNDCTIRASIAGSIAGKSEAVALGNFLNPNTQIARIVDTSGLKMEIAVGEREVGLIEEGAAVEIFIPVCSLIDNSGEVSAIAAGSDPSTGSFTVVVSWENSCQRRVRAGMTASVKVRTLEKEPVIIIPYSAIRTIGGRDTVFVTEDGKAKALEVRTGRRRGNKVEIIAGLSGGETLIVSGLTAVNEGIPLAPTIIGESGDLE